MCYKSTLYYLYCSIQTIIFVYYNWLYSVNNYVNTCKIYIIPTCHFHSTITFIDTCSFHRHHPNFVPLPLSFSLSPFSFQSPLKRLLWARGVLTTCPLSFLHSLSYPLFMLSSSSIKKKKKKKKKSKKNKGEMSYSCLHITPHPLITRSYVYIYTTMPSPPLSDNDPGFPVT